MRFKKRLQKLKGKSPFINRNNNNNNIRNNNSGPYLFGLGGAPPSLPTLDEFFLDDDSGNPPSPPPLPSDPFNSNLFNSKTLLNNNNKNTLDDFVLDGNVSGDLPLPPSDPFNSNLFNNNTPFQPPSSNFIPENVTVPTVQTFQFQELEIIFLDLKQPLLLKIQK